MTIENGWPSPDTDIESRGVVLEGPVISRRAARFRMFRYEVRWWRDGVIPDAGEAVASPQLISDDLDVAHHLLNVGLVPPLIWGRDEFGAGAMWNSNSVISWLLSRRGLPADELAAPAGGRAPGWRVGIAWPTIRVDRDRTLAPHPNLTAALDRGVKAVLSRRL